MVKCVVSGCPNREASGNRSSFSRAPKRFFRFPRDPARVKVWLAALRETDQQDASEHLICEDHFLPEDVSSSGVNSDAIPLMPPCLDGPMGMIGSWGAESSGEEDQWAPGGGGEEEDGGGRIPFNTKLSVPEIPPLDPVGRVAAARPASGEKKSGKHREKKAPPAGIRTREDVSLGVLTRRFLALFLKTPDGSLDVRTAVARLQTRRRRVYDITNVLEGIRLLDKKSANVVQWIGRCPVSGYLGKDESQGEMEDLRLVEETLDGLIKSCAQQLFDMTDDLQNARLAYVSREDVGRLRSFQEQTVIAVRAPEETRLEVPAPTEDSIQVRLKGGRGPILVMTCDVGGEEPTAEKSFLSLEESRITTTLFHRESIQSA